MSAVFLKLVHMSISASWLVLAVVLFRLVLKKAPKSITCILWAMVALRLMIPISIESRLSLVPDTQEIYEELFVPKTAISEGNEIFSSQSFPDEIDNNNHIQIMMPEKGDQDAQSTPDPDPGPASASEPVQESKLPIYVTYVWIVGITLMLAYAGVTYWKLRRKVSASILLEENTFLCDYIHSPFILGIMKPRIYLPSDLGPDTAAYALAHEKAHIKRRDHWWKPLGFMLLAVYWFNPVMWLAYILLSRDIELACDEKVIQEMDVLEKKAYAEALLNCTVSRRMIAVCPLAFGEVGVKARVKSVLNYKKPGFWIVMIAVILCVIAGVCFLTDPEKAMNQNPLSTEDSENHAASIELETNPDEVMSGVESESGEFFCQIFDKSGNILLSYDNLPKEPEVHEITSNIMSVSLQSGTGLSTKWVKFCDINRGIVSETFMYVLAAHNDLVIYADRIDDKPCIVVENMFDRNVFYKVFRLKNVSPVAADFILDYELNETGSLTITYPVGSDYAEKTIRIENLFTKQPAIREIKSVNGGLVIVDIEIDEEGNVIFPDDAP